MFKKRSTESRAFLNGSGNSAGLYGTRDQYHPTTETQLDHKVTSEGARGRKYYDVNLGEDSFGGWPEADIADIEDGPGTNVAYELATLNANPYRRVVGLAKETTYIVGSVAAAAQNVIDPDDYLDTPDPVYGFYPFLGVDSAAAPQVTPAAFDFFFQDQATLNIDEVTVESNTASELTFVIAHTDINDEPAAVAEFRAGVFAWFESVRNSGSYIEFASQTQAQPTNLRYSHKANSIVCFPATIGVADTVMSMTFTVLPYQDGNSDSNLFTATSILNPNIRRRFQYFRVFQEDNRIVDQGRLGGGTNQQTQKPAFVDNFGADTRLKILTQDMSAGYIELMWQPVCSCVRVFAPNIF